MVPFGLSAQVGTRGRRRFLVRFALASTHVPDDCFSQRLALWEPQHDVQQASTVAHRSNIACRVLTPAHVPAPLPPLAGGGGDRAAPWWIIRTCTPTGSLPSMRWRLMRCKTSSELVHMAG